jgi:hypothetical protein
MRDAESARNVLQVLIASYQVVVNDILMIINILLLNLFVYVILNILVLIHM